MAASSTMGANAALPMEETGMFVILAIDEAGLGILVVIAGADLA